MMGVFNNLVMYHQHVPQNSLQSIAAKSPSPTGHDPPQAVKDRGAGTHQRAPYQARHTPYQAEYRAAHAAPKADTLHLGLQD
jgi:hypothetical protein